MIFRNKLLNEIKCNQCRFKYHSPAVSLPQKSRIDISEGIIAVWFGTINIFPFTTHLHSTRTFVQNRINVSSTASDTHRHILLHWILLVDSSRAHTPSVPTGLKWKNYIFLVLMVYWSIRLFYSSSPMINSINADKHLAFGWQRLSNVINV